jgi:hypothetical protein
MHVFYACCVVTMSNTKPTCSIHVDVDVVETHPPEVLQIIFEL